MAPERNQQSKCSPIEKRSHDCFTGPKEINVGFVAQTYLQPYLIPEAFLAYSNPIPSPVSSSLEIRLRVLLVLTEKVGKPEICF